MREPNYRDITHTTLTVLLIAILIVAVFGILRPFLPSLVWATMIVVTTWPVMLRVQARLWGKRGLAALVIRGACTRFSNAILVRFGDHCRQFSPDRRLGRIFPYKYLTIASFLGSEYTNDRSQAFDSMAGGFDCRSRGDHLADQTILRKGGRMVC